MHAFILLERDPSSYSSWLTLMQKKQIPELSVQQIISKYQGFESELISFFEFTNNLEEFKKTLKEYLKLKQLGNCFLLHVISPPSEMPSFLKNQATKLGYDIGCCEEEATIYSSIFHEILFGYFNELVNYKDLLNESYLFPNRSVAEKYVATHHQLSSEGKDVEDYMDMVIYEIWAHKT